MPNLLEREGSVSSPSPGFERRVLLASERLQVKERIKGERSRVNDPSLYTSLSKPSRGWTLERLLKSKRRPISEVVFNHVKKDEGAVETAIRAMDHVLERFQEKGEELQQVESWRVKLLW